VRVPPEKRKRSRSHRGPEKNPSQGKGVGGVGQASHRKKRRFSIKAGRDFLGRTDNSHKGELELEVKISKIFLPEKEIFYPSYRTKFRLWFKLKKSSYHWGSGAL